MALELEAIPFAVQISACLLLVLVGVSTDRTPEAKEIVLLAMKPLEAGGQKKGVCQIDMQHSCSIQEYGVVVKELMQKFAEKIEGEMPKHKP